MLKKVIIKIKEIFIWLFSRKVIEAMNNGATYEEIQELVRKEARRK